jgi:hypothetical protein
LSAPQHTYEIPEKFQNNNLKINMTISSIISHKVSVHYKLP